MITEFLTRLREPFNSISHGMAAILGGIGFVVLLFRVMGLLQLLAVVLYGFSLILLYSASALYHGLNVHERILNLFQRIDRAAIYAFIAGTTTPIALIKIRGWEGWTLFGLLWAAAIVGVLLVIIDPFQSRWSSTIVYLTVGWISVIFMGPLVESLSPAGMAWCIAGGLIYTVGALIYMFDGPTVVPGYVEAHELWHLFAMIGSSAHFVVISVYTL